MELKLTHDEVQQYFDMRDDLNYYKLQVALLEDEIALLRQDATAAPAYTELTRTTITNDPLPDVSTLIAVYDAGESRENRQGKAWDDLDLHIIRMAVGKVHPAFMTSSLAQLLGRTEQSINSKANELGFRIKNDRVVYKHD